MKFLENGVFGNFKLAAIATPFRPLWRDQLLRCHWELEIDACIVIYFLGRSEVKLIERYIAALLIPDIKCGARQEVVVNLLWRPTVFEEKRDSIRVLRG